MAQLGSPVANLHRCFIAAEKMRVLFGNTAARRHGVSLQPFLHPCPLAHGQKGRPTSALPLRSCYTAPRPCKQVLGVLWNAGSRRGPPMLNSARRPLTSPSRGRLVEWSDQRPGIERLHFRPRRLCRRCAFDASYESVGNAGTIDVTTSDIPLRTDSV